MSYLNKKIKSVELGTEFNENRIEVIAKANDSDLSPILDYLFKNNFVINNASKECIIASFVGTADLVLDKIIQLRKDAWTWD